jgi:hypothetical protein
MLDLFRMLDGLTKPDEEHAGGCAGDDDRVEGVPRVSGLSSTSIGPTLLVPGVQTISTEIGPTLLVPGVQTVSTEIGPTLLVPGVQTVSTEIGSTLSGHGAPGDEPAEAALSGRWSVFRLPVTPASRYALGDEIGQGGIGRVLVARDTQLDRLVAIKEPLRGAGPNDDRFVREALLAARLEHPSIVPLYDAGRWSSGRPYYAMRLLEGRALSDILAERPLLDARLPLLPSLLAVTEAMAYAHSKRIIHRDLKPANLILGAFGEAVVIDWGLAKELDEEEVAATAGGEVTASGQALTATGTVMGTPAYMPPEQAAGEPVDERADVYALGAVLYHVIAGRPPYEGDGVQAIVAQVLAGPPRPLASFEPPVAKELRAIVAKAMAWDLAQRYRTAKRSAISRGV